MECDPSGVRPIPVCVDCGLPPCYMAMSTACEKPPVCYACEPIDPCEFSEGCNEEPFEARNLEVYLIEGEKVTPAIWGSAEVFVPVGDEVTITFNAKYGSFEPRVFSGSKAEPNKVYDKYDPPCEEKAPADGFDEAWVVVYDRSTHQYAETEHVKFNIEEPENVHVLHPVG